MRCTSWMHPVTRIYCGESGKSTRIIPSGITSRIVEYAPRIICVGQFHYRGEVRKYAVRRAPPGTSAPAHRAGSAATRETPKRRSVSSAILENQLACRGLQLTRVPRRGGTALKKDRTVVALNSRLGSSSQQNGCERRLQERDLVVEPPHRGPTTLQLALVRVIPRHFHGRNESLGRLLSPASIGCAAMWPIK
jgi:hypothetical protein